MDIFTISSSPSVKYENDVQHFNLQSVWSLSLPPFPHLHTNNPAVNP